MKSRKFELEDLVKPNSKAPKYARTRHKMGLSAAVVDYLGDGQYVIQWSDAVEFKGQGYHYDLEDEERGYNEDESEIPTDVKEFIADNNKEIEKIRERIKPEVDNITNRQIVVSIAESIKRIPSPKVYKLMLKLTEIDENLGDLELSELYKQAESILESVLE